MAIPCFPGRGKQPLHGSRLAIQRPAGRCLLRTSPVVMSAISGTADTLPIPNTDSVRVAGGSANALPGSNRAQAITADEVNWVFIGTFRSPMPEQMASERVGSPKNGIIPQDQSRKTGNAGPCLINVRHQVILRTFSISPKSRRSFCPANGQSERNTGCPRWKGSFRHGFHRLIHRICDQILFPERCQ